jgi:hypothetical protein
VTSLGVLEGRRRAMTAALWAAWRLLWSRRRRGGGVAWAAKKENKETLIKRGVATWRQRLQRWASSIMLYHRDMGERRGAPRHEGENW